MAHIRQDNVSEVTATTGTGNITVGGASDSASRTFASVCAVNDTFEYAIRHRAAAEWEYGIGTYSAANTIARTTVLASSNANAAVNFSAGNKDVFIVSSFSHLPFWRKSFLYVETDFLGAATADTGESSWAIWDLAVISSGTQAKIAGDANHPGILQISSSTTANSGAYIRTEITAFLIAGGERAEFIFRIPNLTNTTVRMGFLDTGTSTDATDGVYIEVPSTGDAVLKTANNNTRTTSATIATLAANTWYRAVIEVAGGAASATGSIFNGAGTLLGSQTNTTNIPTAAGRETGHGIVATNSGTTAVAILQIDYMNLAINRLMQR